MSGRNLFFVFLLLLGASCQDEPDSAYQTEMFLGRWELSEALRNGEPTQTLGRAFFEFLPENKLLTNLAGVQEEYTYELQGEQLSQKGGRLPLDMKIDSLSDSTLVLSMTIRDTAFKLTLNRARLEAEQEETLQ